MHVGLLVLGDLVVDDVGDVVDVDAAGGDIGGDQHVDVAGAERLERLLAGGLSQVAMHRADLEAAFGQLVGDFLGGALGAGEDHRGAAALGLQYPADQFDLVQRVGAVDELFGGVVGGRRMRGLRPDVGGLVHERTGQRDDRVRHRRREQHGLPFVGDLLENPLDVGQEAEVEHFVGLVEHQHRQPAELKMALLGEIEQPPRRADDHVDTLLQRLDLRLVGPATVDRRHGQLSLTGREVFRRGSEVPGRPAGRVREWGPRLARGGYRSAGDRRRW